MPFVKDDPNINKLDTLPEKFTKEFVDYVCHLYANNTSVLEMSEILNTPQNTIKKYLSNGVVWFNKLNVHDLSAIRIQRASIAKSLHTAEYDFLKNQKSNEKIFLSAEILATEYVTQMKKLITEERTRLEQLKESMYGVC